MVIAATVLQTVATVAKPWASLYSDSRAVSSAVTFFTSAAFCSPVDSLSLPIALRFLRCVEPRRIGADYSSISGMHTHGC